MQIIEIKKKIIAIIYIYKYIYIYIYIIKIMFNKTIVNNSCIDKINK